MSPRSPSARRVRSAWGLALAAPLLLAACQDSGERAESFFLSGLELREEGDLDRAVVELRNVFRYDAEHLEARRALAEIQQERGLISQAYSQYLRLVEQYPDEMDVRAALARIAIEQRQWDEAERHGRMVLDAAADGAAGTAIDDPAAARVIALALDYREAVEAGDAEGRDAARARARALLEEDPLEIIPRQIVLAEQLDVGPGEAPAPSVLADIDAAIEGRPDVLQYYLVKLQTLGALAGPEPDEAARAEIEAHLRATFDRFPEEQSVQQALIAWYLQERDFAAAEAFLRELAGPVDGAPEGHVTVVRLIERVEGREAALAEVDALIEANAADPANLLFWRALRASYQHDGGDTQAAAAALREAVAEGEAAREAVEEGTEAEERIAAQLRRVKGVLARLLIAQDNVVGARALVEEVLAEDGADVTALTLRGAMLVEDDRPDEAIVDLRRALGQAPENTDVILLLAEAHGRSGNRELMGERLATAVEVSGSAPREALRYADYLLAEDRVVPARAVLSDAYAAAPGNVELATRVARLALQADELGTVRGVVADLEALAARLEQSGADGENGSGDAAVAARAANSLRTALLLREGRREEGLALLAGQAGTGGEDARSALALIRARLAAGEVEEARSYLDELRAAAPDDLDLKMLDAALTAAEGDPEASEAILREVIAADPGAEGAVRMLHGQLMGQGRTEEADALLSEALEASPRSRVLRLIRAGLLERRGEMEEAIALYEDLYEENSSDVVVANNLSSMLSTYRDDAESLERAAAVAQRLRGTDVAPFQDTYGWIAYRQGRHAEAREYLEPAARALPDNALVQYHYGMTLAALDRPEAAAAALRRAIALSAGSTLPQFEVARATLSEIGGAAVEETAVEETASGEAGSAEPEAAETEASGAGDEAAAEAAAEIDDGAVELEIVPAD